MQADSFPSPAAGSNPPRRITVERAVRIMAGTFVLTSLALAHWVDVRWLFLAVFVGVNLIQSALTGFCPAEIIFRKLGLRDAGSCCG